MATLEFDPDSGRYRVRFRYDGRSYKRSTHTKHRRVAEAMLGQVDEALRLLKTGLAEIPPDAEPGAFIVSGTRIRRAVRPPSPTRTLSSLFETYQRELAPGSKEETTLRGEKLHMSHLQKHLGGKTPLSGITAGTLQRYVSGRSQDTHRNRPIGPNTIKKEITTFRLIWNWAIKQGYLDRPAPTAGISYSKRDEKPHFMTMGEIQRLLDRGGITKEKESELWESLYLTRNEVEDLLECVLAHAPEPFVYPMFLLVAHTGMRRSELIRAESSDFDFEGRTILIREKKRSRKHALSFRRVPMTRRVVDTFEPWIKGLPERHQVLSRPETPQLAKDTVAHFFKITLRDTPWQPVRGFHVFRHSFASNAAAEGIDQRMIDEWMGHQTEEMRRRYRHLAPSQQQAAIDAVFPGTAKPSTNNV